MSKQDIEKRLGFAAQGVKAEMAIGSYKQGDRTVTVNGKKYEVLPYQMDFFIKELATLDTPEWRADVVKEYLRRGYIKATASRPGVKAKMAASFEDRQRAAGYKWQVRYTKQLGKTDYHNAMEIDETLAFATESAARKWADTMIKKGWYKGISGTPEKVLTAKVVPFARPGAKAKMALTIYTVGAKNACYEALANLGVLAKLASDTKSGWDFHVTAMIDHVKSAMSQLESSPAQAGTHLERAINTLGMLRKIDPVRLNDIQKGSLKQLIGYVAKSLRDARANIKVVTTASRPGVKAKFEKEYVLWGLPKGKTDRLYEKVLSTQAKTPAQMEDVKKRAAAAGWHSFRVQILDLSKPYKGFARSGVKAKFATEVGRKGNKSAMISRDVTGTWYAYVVQRIETGIGKDEDMLGTMRAYSTEDRAKRAAIKALDTSGFSRPGVKAKMAAEIASDPRDKDFEKLKTLKGVVHQGKGFYIIPGKLMTPERRTKVKRSTQRYELSNMGDLVGWGTNHPNVNDYRLKDWAEAFA